VVELERIDTQASSLGARTTTRENLALILQNVEKVVTVSDDEMKSAVEWLWNELGIVAELGGAASIAALLTQRIELDDLSKVGTIVCGRGSLKGSSL
jgi:threonine dehydratase